MQRRRWHGGRGGKGPRAHRGGGGGIAESRNRGIARGSQAAAHEVRPGPARARHGPTVPPRRRGSGQCLATEAGHDERRRAAGPVSGEATSARAKSRGAEQRLRPVTATLPSAEATNGLGFKWLHLLYSAAARGGCPPQCAGKGNNAGAEDGHEQSSLKQRKKKEKRNGRQSISICATSKKKGPYGPK